MLVGDILRRAADRDPNKLGVVFGDKRFTWQEVNARVNRLANGLLRLGLEKQDRVAILSRACHEYFEFYFATAKAGLVQVAINQWAAGKDLVRPINDCGAKALIVHQEYVDRVKDVASQLEGINYYIGIGAGHPYPYDFETLVRENSPQEPQVEVDEEDLYCLAYTSGTTGIPKGVMHTHKSMVTAAHIIALETQIKHSDVFLMIIPFSFASYNSSRFHGVLMSATCVIMNFEPESVLQAIEREKVTYMHIGPTALKALLAHPNLNQYDVSSMRRMVYSGASVPPSVAERADEVFGPVGAPGLGLTECQPVVLWLDRGEIGEVTPERMKRLRLSTGKKCLGMDVRVVREDGTDVAPDDKEIGEIIIKGDTMMKGYWNKPEETAKALRNGWLYTEDLATIDEEGYVYLVDRKREMIKSGGLMVFPREIEELIYTHPAVLHCAVIGVPHEKWGETPKALIVLKPGMNATEEEIMELCEKNMASYKKPTSIEFVDSLTFNVSGKIMKHELREKYWKGYETRVSA